MAAAAVNEKAIFRNLFVNLAWDEGAVKVSDNDEDCELMGWYDFKYMAACPRAILQLAACHVGFKYPLVSKAPVWVHIQLRGQGIDQKNRGKLRWPTVDPPQFAVKSRDFRR